MHQPVRAFTLIELLVVVTIITLLVAMLLPAMEEAMTAAQRAKCLSHIHVQHVALTQYAADNGGWFAPGATMGNSPDYHRTWQSGQPGYPPYDRATLMRKYLPNGDAVYCPITAAHGDTYATKYDVNAYGFGGWNTDQIIITTPYMWMPGFATASSAMRMINGEPEPPLNLPESSPRHTWITHRIDYYAPGLYQPVEMQDLGHFGSGWFQPAQPYDSHKTSEMPIGTGDGGAFLRTRDEMGVRIVIGGNYPDAANPGMPGAYIW